MLGSRVGRLVVAAVVAAVVAGGLGLSGCTGMKGAGACTTKMPSLRRLDRLKPARVFRLEGQQQRNDAVTCGQSGSFVRVLTAEGVPDTGMLASDFLKPLVDEGWKIDVSGLPAVVATSKKRDLAVQVVDGAANQQLLKDEDANHRWVWLDPPLKETAERLAAAGTPFIVVAIFRADD